MGILLIIRSNDVHHFTTNNLITKNQSTFWPDDSTSNQLIDLVDEIHQSFDDAELKAEGMARWVNFQAETEWCVRFIAEITTNLLK